MILDVRGVSTQVAASAPPGGAAASGGGGGGSSSGSGESGGDCCCPINWLLLSSLAKGAALALALDDYKPSTAPASPAAADASAVEAEENRLAGFACFTLAAAVPGPRAALSLAKGRATTAAAGGGGSGGSALSSAAAAAAMSGSIAAARGPGGRGVCVELEGMLSVVRLVRPGLAEKLWASGSAAVGGGKGDGGGERAAGGGGVVVKEFMIPCAMTEPQAKVYSAVAR